jgi:hypothetical protein
VASDLGPIRELDALAPGALRRFSPYEPAALAAAVRDALADATDAGDPNVAHLAGQLATDRVIERYVRLYRSATGGPLVPRPEDGRRPA